MPALSDQQRVAFQDAYRAADDRWSFHYTVDPLTRYLRDRRLELAVSVINGAIDGDPRALSVLVVCGGVGGEGTYFRRRGFKDVTVSDFSAEALERCNRFDPTLKTLLLDAEHMDLPDSSYDIVVVQDGLHHLPRPALGFTEMLRVARLATVLIEPHSGLVARVLGREWEVQGDAINYVYRWNRMMLEQATRSYLLSRTARVIGMRVWDHSLVMVTLVGRLPQALRLTAARVIYGALSKISKRGNMMVGVVVKDSTEVPRRLVSH